MLDRSQTGAPRSPRWVHVALLLGACDGDSDRLDVADRFADAIVAFEPGPFAGFGEDRLPEVVLGGPRGGGASAGGLDVLSLGREGWIILEFVDELVVDGPGPDLIVFENPFPGWIEPGRVEVSLDGETWMGWPCDGRDPDGGYPGCAGVQPVMANVDQNDVDPWDPLVAGGDRFDLEEIDVEEARFVRITDDGTAPEMGYQGQAGGFDLDAVAVVHGVSTPVAGPERRR